MTKICIKCGLELPHEDFYLNKKSKDGLMNKCKKCVSEQNKKHYEENREKLLIASKNYRENGDRERRLEYAKNYYANNKNMFFEYYKEYRKNNKEYYKEYYKDHKEHRAKYYAEHKLEILITRRRYVASHLEEFRNKSQRRRVAKRSLSSSFTIGQWEQCKRYFNDCCAYCGEKRALAQEHFFPLSKGGEYSHNNIIPACKSCNSSKKNKDFLDWYPKQAIYSKKREKKILQYLNYGEDHAQQLSIFIANY